MPNRNQRDTKSESFLSNLMKFVFIFFVLVIIILSIHYMGFLDNIENSSTGPSTPIKTIPTTTTVPAIPTTTTANPISTQTTTGNGVTYPPATMPINPTTQTETPIQPPVVTPYDISDEAMQALINVRYLSIHPDSRSGKKLTELKNIVVHYTGNPRSTADQNWRHFENNKPSTSAHFIIGLEGEIIQCMPLDEVAWAVGTDGNYTSISIECCHPDETGKFTDATYESLIKLVSWLCNKFGLGREAVIRHYDYPRYNSAGLEWHKQCPLYYANEQDPASHKRWEEFKNDLIIID
jgi:hypothetical protein